MTQGPHIDVSPWPLAPKNIENINFKVNFINQSIYIIWQLEEL